MSTRIRASLRAALLGGTALALVGGAASVAQAASMVDRGLEQRVSDLEAEVRLLKNRVKALEDRKLDVPDKIVVSGNSRVKVTLYGRVNRAVRFAFQSNDAQIHHVDNDNSSSRIGILAEGRLFPDLKISALTEVEWQENRRSNTVDANDGNLRVRARKVDLWFTHASLGRLYIGHGNAAAKDTSLVTLSGTAIVFDAGACSNDPIPFGPGNGNQPGGFNAGNFCGALDSSRENRIMYRTPKVAGFWAQVSHGEQDAIEAALFYEGNPFGISQFDVAGGFGFQYLPTAGASVPGRGRGGARVYKGSLGVLHKPTGLNVNFASGYQSSGAFENPFFYWIEGGWQGDVWAMGKTYLAGHFGNYDKFSQVNGLGPDSHAWVAGVALNQKVDAAATELYVGYRYQDAKLRGSRLNGTHVIITGARIKF